MTIVRNGADKFVLPDFPVRIAIDPRSANLR